MAEWMESWCVGESLLGLSRRLIIKVVVGSYTKAKGGPVELPGSEKETLRQIGCCNCQTHSIVIMLTR